MQDDDKRIPGEVIVRLFAYRDAARDSRETLVHYREAAIMGDEEKVSVLEKQREAKRLVLDRARWELDEAVRSWA
jgi:hypothetical protein